MSANNHDANLFADLSDEWQRDAPNNAPVIRPEHVLSDLQRRERRERRMLILEMVVAALGTLYGVYMLTTGDWVAGLACLVFSGGALSLVLLYQAHQDDLPSVSVAKHLAALYQFERNRHRRGWVGLLVSIGAILFLLAILMAESVLSVDTHLRAVVAISALVCAAGIVRSAREISASQAMKERLRVLSNVQE